MTRFNGLLRFSCWSLLVGIVSPVEAVEFISVETTHVGGFFADGVAMNAPHHQNYFVGYGTTPGFPRTSERRSFFVFHLPEVPGTIIGAKLTLTLAATTSLIFGHAPGPVSSPPPLDDMESFALGAIPISPSVVMDPHIGTPEVIALFGGMDDFPVAPTIDFLLDDPPGVFPMLVDVPFDGFGLGILTASAGGSLVLTGWMPTWTHDDRTFPGGEVYEKNELIFGLSDITGPAGPIVPKPVLEIAYIPVPEPGTAAVVGVGFIALFRRLKSRRQP